MDTGSARSADGNRPEAGEDENASSLVSYLKVSISVSFTGLVVVMVLYSADEVDMTRALWSLGLGAAGATVSAVVSEVLSNLAVYEEMPDENDFRHLAMMAGAALLTTLPALALIGLSSTGALSVRTALLSVAFVYIGGLAIVAVVAARNVPMSWIQKVVTWVLLAALVGGVIAIKVVEHGLK